MEKQCRLVGMDLGTEWCKVAVWYEGRAEVIKGSGSDWLPSHVSFTANGVLTGEDARS